MQEEDQGALIKIAGPPAHELIALVEELKRSGANVEITQTADEVVDGEAAKYQVSGASEAELASIAETLQRSGVDVEIVVPST